MKKTIFIFGFLLALCEAQVFASLCVKGQTSERIFTYAATIGTGISLNEPSCTPFAVQVLGYYRVGERFSAGAGSGFSFYVCLSQYKHEMTLIPVFADAKFAITRPRKFTPYATCSGGYAFAANKNANGGVYLNVSVGVQYALLGKMKLQLSAGYELQQSERLKEHANDYFSAGFAEKLNRNMLAFKVGIEF